MRLNSSGLDSAISAIIGSPTCTIVATVSFESPNIFAVNVKARSTAWSVITCSTVACVVDIICFSRLPAPQRDHVAGSLPPLFSAHLGERDTIGSNNGQRAAARRPLPIVRPCVSSARPEQRNARTLAARSNRFGLALVALVVAAILLVVALVVAAILLVVTLVVATLFLDLLLIQLAHDLNAPSFRVSRSCACPEYQTRLTGGPGEPGSSGQ